MKYGLMYYEATDNIGDDIQTYAAIKYLPHIDYYIDRENLSCFVPEKKEYVSMIMNGWFIHNKLAWPPSPYINPLLISMHFKELEETDVGDMYIKGYGGDFLKKFGPVGARDNETQKRLFKNDIESYFSGCMTLTIDKFPKVRKKKKICLVDVSQDVIKKVTDNTKYNVEILTHSLKPQEIKEKSVKERMDDVENLLKKYQESKLVITTRLHVALPCVALGTPVMVLHKEFFDEDRLGTFFYLFTNYTEDEFLNMDVSKLIESPKANNHEYKKIRKSVDKVCKQFIKQCEKVLNNSEIGQTGSNSKMAINNNERDSELEIDINNNERDSDFEMAINNNERDSDFEMTINGRKRVLKFSELPEVEEYKKYANKLGWYKAIYEIERLIVEKIEQKRVEEYELYHRNLEELYKKMKDL